MQNYLTFLPLDPFPYKSHDMFSVQVGGSRQRGRRRSTLGYYQRDLRADLGKKGRRRVDPAEAQPYQLLQGAIHPHA